MMTVCGFMEIPLGRKIAMPNYDDGDNGWALPRRIHHESDGEQGYGLFLSHQDAAWRWWQGQCIVERQAAPSILEPTELQIFWAQQALGAEMAVVLETEITKNEREAARKVERVRWLAEIRKPVIVRANLRAAGSSHNQLGFNLNESLSDLSLEFPSVDREDARNVFQWKKGSGTAVGAHYEVRSVFQELLDYQKAAAKKQGEG